MSGHFVGTVRIMSKSREIGRAARLPGSSSGVCRNCLICKSFQLYLFPLQEYGSSHRISYFVKLLRTDRMNRRLDGWEGTNLKKKLLIVDDQNGIRILLMEVFSSEGYETYQASNGKLALEIVRNVSPDLVLLDMKIPGMDGLDILKHIKSINPSIKVIMMTAYGELDMIKEATDLGAIMHFTKPFDIDELRQAVNQHLCLPPNNSYAVGS